MRITGEVDRCRLYCCFENTKLADQEALSSQMNGWDLIELFAHFTWQNLLISPAGSQ